MILCIKTLTVLRSEAHHASDFKLRLQTTIRIRPRQDIVVTVIIVVNIHRSLVAYLANSIRAKSTIADSLNILLGSIAAVGVASTGTSLAALRDAENLWWILAHGEGGTGVAAHLDGD
jgi:hypothetical protein